MPGRVWIRRFCLAKFLCMRFHNTVQYEKVLDHSGISDFILYCLEVPESRLFVGFDGSVIACGYTKQYSAMVPFYPTQLRDAAIDKSCSISMSTKPRCHRPSYPEIAALVLRGYLTEYQSVAQQA